MFFSSLWICPPEKMTSCHPKTTTTQATVWIFISILSCDCLSSPIKKDLMPPKPEKNLPTKLATFIFPHLSHLWPEASNQPARFCSKDGHGRLLSSTSCLVAALESCLTTFPRDGGGHRFFVSHLGEMGLELHTRNPPKKNGVVETKEDSQYRYSPRLVCMVNLYIYTSCVVC